MNKLIALLTLLLPTALFAQGNSDPVTSGGAGAFTEFGYDARAVAMGNSLVAVTRGEFQYAAYNPAVAAFQDGYRASFSSAILGLDRTLSCIAVSVPMPSSSKRTDSTSATTSNSDLGSRLRLQLGWLRAGISNIDMRDAEGDQLGLFGSAEHEFLGAFGVRLSPKLALGFSARFYRHVLDYPSTAVTSAKSGGFGLDLGAIYSASDKLNIGISLQHVAAKYHWDSGELYGQTGSSTTDYFPFIARFGASYVPVENLLVSAELDHISRQYDEQDDNGKTMTANETAFGAQYELAKGFTLRAGLRGLDLTNQLSDQISTSAGFAYTFRVDGFEPTISYALMNEAAATDLTHFITVGVRF